MAGGNFDNSILTEFIIESKEHLDKVENNLIELENNPSDLDIINTIFRAVHSVKGAASFLGLKKISQLTHRMENILDSLRKQKLDISSEIIDMILSGTDVLIKLICELEEILTREIDNSLTEDGDLPDFDSYSQIDISAIMSVIENLKCVPAQNDSTNKNPSTNTDVSQSQNKNKQTQETNNHPAPNAGVSENNNLKDSIKLNQALSQALSIFLVEAVDIFDDVSKNLLEIEKNKSNQEAINSAFRGIHNFKGNARYLGFANTEKLAHHMENILDGFRNKKISVSSQVIDLLLKCLDALQELIKSISENGTDVSLNIDTLVSQLQKYSDEKPENNIPKAKASKTKPEQSKSNIDNETLDIFINASAQHIANIKEVGVKIKEGKETELDYDVLVRAITGLKNSSNYLGFEETKNLSEYMEALSRKIRDRIGSNKSNFIALLERYAQYLMDNVESLKTSGKEKVVDVLLIADIMLETQLEPKAIKPQQPSSEPENNQSKSNDQENTPTKIDDSSKETQQLDPNNAQKKVSNIEKTIRVDQNKLDVLMNLIGELIINRNRFISITKKVEDDYKIPEISKELKLATYMIKRISDDLQSTIVSARMVPVGTVFNKFPRMVRDLSKAKQKDIVLNISGEETELDKTVIEQIGDPLVHLIRNSADHGLEDTEERVKKGKPAQGNVYLRAYHEGNGVVIQVEDDGKGIDPQKIKKKALEKGIITESDFNTMSDDAAVNLIFAAGFSTAEQVSNISGRGVGMDVVRDNITKLNGRILIDTKVDRGTKFTMILPLTVAIVETIMVKVFNSVYAIPLQCVSETVRIKYGAIKYLNKKKSINLRGKVIGVEYLSDTLGISMEENYDDEKSLNVVIINADGKTVGFVVDELVDKQEVVIKPLIDYLSCIKGISGATILGDGTVILILEPSELVNIATYNEKQLV